MLYERSRTRGNKQKKNIEKWGKKEKEKQRIQGKPNNKNKHLWFYLIHKNLRLFKNKKVLKKVVYTITFHLQFLCIAGYLKRRNDTPSSIYINIQIII